MSPRLNSLESLFHKEGLREVGARRFAVHRSGQRPDTPESRDGIMLRNSMDKRPISDVDRQRYIDWLKVEIDVVDRDHHHKETMAWVATAFYLPAVVGLAYSSANRIGSNCALQITFTVFLVVLLLAVLCFLNSQFRNRWDAAHKAIGLKLAMALLCDSSKELFEEELQADSLNGKVFDPGMEYPRFIQRVVKQEIERGKPYRTPIEGVRLALRERNVDSRLRTEIPCYLGATLATALGVIILWVDC